MAYINCNDISLGYEDGIVASHIDFKVEKGDYLCIVGENGAGKSTLMKTLLKLIKPVSGELTYGDGLKPGQIGYLPQQNPVQRDFPANVFEIALSGNLSRKGFKPFYNKEDKKRTADALEKLGISDLSKKSYRRLSGGQQQRVLLARALCAADKLILLDEPVSGLDPQATAEFYALIRKLHGEGMSVIMVSHDLHAALGDSDHILQIGDHSQLYFGKTENYVKSRAYYRLGLNNHKRETKRIYNAGYKGGEQDG